MADKGGRPPKYKAEYAKQAAKLYRLGATDAEMADFFAVSVPTLNTWKWKQAGFFKSLKRAKDEADARVEESLYHRAMGYSHPAVKILSTPNGIVREEYIEHYPPDTTAMIFWLKNRRREDWRDKLEHEHSGSISIAEELRERRARAADRS